MEGGSRCVVFKGWKVILYDWLWEHLPLLERLISILQLRLLLLDSL